MVNHNNIKRTPKILILSGEPGSGKTTLCQEGAAWCSTHGILQTGIICPGVYVASTRIAINAYNVQNGTTRVLGIRKDLEPDELLHHIAERKEELPPPYIETERWCFSEPVFNECNSWLAPVPHGVFWIDELGILEFTVHKGFTKAFEVLRSQMYKLAIAVIRPGLLPYFAQQVPDVAYEIINIPEHAQEQPAFMQYFLNLMLTCGI